MFTPTLIQFLTGLAMGLYTPEQRVEYAQGFLARDYRYDPITLSTLRYAATGEWREGTSEGVEYNIRHGFYQSV